MTSKVVRQFTRKFSALPWAKQLQSSISYLLRRLPISSEIIGPPKGFYESTSSWIATSNPDKNQIKGSYIEIDSNHQICLSNPKCLDEDIHWKFRRAYEYQSQNRTTFVAVIPGGRVWSDSAVITPDDKLLADVSREFRKNINENSIFKKWKLRPAYQINGTAAVLTAPAGQTYYHWMFEVLPRLDLICRSGISIDSVDKFIVNSSHLPFQKETLAHLGISQTKIIDTRSHSHVKANKLVVPSLWIGYGKVSMISKWACDFLRKEFLPNKSIEKLDSSERIYISRATASHRRLLNEPEVVNYLTTLGFTVLALESMSVAEQISAFSSAKVIVAPHGGGLTNIVFCNPGTKIIEFFSPNYVNICYWSVSNHVGLEHYYLIGEGEKPPEYLERPVQYPYKEDMAINIESLKSILKLAGIK